MITAGSGRILATTAGATAGTRPDRRRRRARRRDWSALAGVTIAGLFVLMALAAPWVATHDPLRQDLLKSSRPPSAAHLLGTDELGRDLFSRIVHGARISLQIALLSAVGAVSVGTALGVVAGFYGGWVDEVIMRANDILLAFPGLVLAIAIISALGPSAWNIIIAVGLYSMPLFARLARGSTLSVREQEYVVAGRAIGAGSLRLILLHVLPSIAGPIVVMASLRIGTIILTASGLSFLGLGVQPPDPEWGAMLSEGRQYVRSAPHLIIFPGLVISLVVLGFNLIGTWLRDRLDPRQQLTGAA